jgi:hypothetical protein
MTTKAKRSTAKGSRHTAKGERSSEPQHHGDSDTSVVPKPKPGERSDSDAIGRPVQLDDGEIGRPVELGGETEDTPDEHGTGADRRQHRSDSSESEH